MALKLIIGNKNYSSWSFRPWLAMKVAKIPFEEEVIPLDANDFKTRLGAFSGSGKVPLLVDDDVYVWESLAIWLTNFPVQDYGHMSPPRAPELALLLPKCMPVLARCDGICP